MYSKYLSFPIQTPPSQSSHPPSPESSWPATAATVLYATHRIASHRIVHAPQSSPVQYPIHHPQQAPNPSPLTNPPTPTPFPPVCPPSQNTLNPPPIPYDANCIRHLSANGCAPVQHHSPPLWWGPVGLGGRLSGRVGGRAYAGAVVEGRWTRWDAEVRTGYTTTYSAAECT